MLNQATSQPVSDLALGNALCWRNISDFTRMAFGIVSPADVYAHNWHIDCIAEHLHAVHEGHIKRLIINVPPRSLKSILCTVSWPAWLLGRDPTTRIITASYGHDLALKHSVWTRKIMESAWYQQMFPGVTLSDDQNTKENFMTNAMGFRKATSVGGSILGDGGDYLIFDDLIKASDARSDTIRENTNSWLSQDFLTRLNQPMESRIVGVMQRFHLLDPTGYLKDSPGWHLLKIPAEAPRKTFIELRGMKWEMEEGELLHEERMDRQYLEDVRNGPNGEFIYTGQYLQDPVPDGGAEFKVEWYQLYESINHYGNMNFYLVVDPGGDKKKKGNDYTAMRLWGLGQDKNYYLAHTVRDRLNTTERVNLIFKLQREFSAKCGKPVMVLYKSRGFITEFHAIKERMARETYHFPMIEVVEKGSKNDRIRRMIPACQQRRMWLTRSFTYVDHTKKVRDLTKDFLDHEVAVFPVGAHDDMLDADSELFNEELADVVVFPQLSTGTYKEPASSVWDL